EDAVHRRADLMTDVGEELALGAAARFGRLLRLLKGLSRPFLIVNVGEGAEPADDAARPVLADTPVVDRQRPPQVPAVRPPGGPAEARPGLVGPAGAARLGPVVAPLLPVVRVQGGLPASAGQLRRRQAGVLGPAAVVVINTAIPPRRPHQLRDRLS